MTSPIYNAHILNQLDAFIAKALPKDIRFGSVQDVKPAGSGQSNPTYILTDVKGMEIVLRQRPYGKLLPSAHAIDREYRVMQALAGGPVPVPRMLAYTDDTAILGALFFDDANSGPCLYGSAPAGHQP